MELEPISAHHCLSWSLRSIGKIFVASLFCLLLPLPAFCSEKPAAEAEKISPEAAKFFEERIRPILAESCYKCHGEEKQKGELRVDGLATLLLGGESTLPAIVPGSPDESLLIEAIRYESYEMPPNGKLKEEQIEDFVKWVEMGAPWPGAHSADHPVAQRKEKITDEDRDFWSFQPIAHPAVPKIPSQELNRRGIDPTWPKNDIDAFILEKQFEVGLTPAPVAEKLTLLRRAKYDLTGLPPTPEEMEEFLADDSDDAYERLIDRLLASPQYGERWARHWLDIVRYAESDGFNQDAYRPNAWHYRDYVIKSFNEDKPYDQFVREQLAGDELAPDDLDALAATGFLRAGIYEYNQRDIKNHWSEILNEMTDVTADVFLGLGMGCARCHDHKFDPLLQKDYYQLQSFFSGVYGVDDYPLATEEELTTYREALAVWEEKTADIQAKIDELETAQLEKSDKASIIKFTPDLQAMYFKAPEDRTAYEHQMADLIHRQVLDGRNKVKSKFASTLKGEKLEQWKTLKAELAKFDKEKPKPLPTARVIQEVLPKAPQTVIPGARASEPVEPGFLAVMQGDRFPEYLTSPGKITPLPQSTGRRSRLAEWITQEEHPLTTRVIVNRLWQCHFGTGLVATTSDFGRLGEPPSHPELLDWLARKFVEDGWSLKAMHRRMMTSATYRQTALRVDVALAEELDPANRLLWKQPIRRLDAEQIRDTMLIASGELRQEFGGPSVSVATPRRSVYLQIKRNRRDYFLEVFDWPDGLTSTAKRNTTTTANQALLMINGDYVLGRAKKMAERLLKEKDRSSAERIDLAYRLLWGRAASPQEIAATEGFLEKQQTLATDQDKSELTAWTDFCHVLLNSNAFLYCD
ncbi:Planctomycete cytochrome C [Planctomycetales bacterium 10988]|nr:Planctomycete cytochrome C [Planctomycetales bacterium 10988]